MGLDARMAVVGAALTALVVAPSGDASAVRGSTAPSESRTAQASAPPCSAGLVALTFDDGPARGLTVRLVRILERRHVPATFFMVGSRVRTAPRAARVVTRAGFPVGNHTWSHPKLTRLTDGRIREELLLTTAILRRLGVPPTPLMRPPYGDYDARVLGDVNAMDLVPVLWDVDSRDWRGGSARRIADTILQKLRPHRSNIVLQHDGVRNSPASVAAVPRVIRVARHRGYCFTRLGPDGRMEPLTPPTETPPVV